MPHHASRVLSPSTHAHIGCSLGLNFPDAVVWVFWVANSRLQVKAFCDGPLEMVSAIAYGVDQIWVDLDDI